MEIRFKNTTKYTQDKYWEFLKFHDMKYGTQYRILTIVVAIIILYMVAANIVAKNITLVYILFIGFAGFVFYRYYSQEKIVKDEVKGESLQKQKEYTFTFYEDLIYIEDGRSEQYIPYHQICKVYETSGYFYMYTDKTHSLMLSKNGFVVGTSEEFTVLMKKKYGFKFKVEKTILN